ncbi:undecaprenyl-diphosphate phosphatase [Microbaculum marinum]|uniref:Undecaprenyl-diphosphatase n=1 Tax=Microbaculum marinum TaxID=1764581 RepID=A0AAW9RBJ3_9HYPH
MTADQLVVLAIIQGLTEFLPVSSSGHLNLLHLLTTYPDEGPAIDVAIHVGSLVAVMAYFWRDMLYLIGGLRDLVLFRATSARRLILLLILASVPLAIVGFVMIETGLVDAVRSLEVIAWTTIVFALVLWACDALGSRAKIFSDIGISDAVWVGLAQCIALIPGVSRSGITMSAARALGFERTEAARFSMVLAIPAILATGAGTALTMSGDQAAIIAGDALVAAALSAVAAFASIWFMMALLKRTSMMPFVLYRLAMGVVLLWVLYR